ncbi:MAG: hypothetical protein QOK37_4531 [Thermoanaerobaculia bacterium]|nr:hypothetical protein [Thermoanaerobaculia bacterium]
MDPDATVLAADPPTDPIPDLPPLPSSPPAPAKPPAPATAPVFARSHFQFQIGVPAGETAYIRSEGGDAVLSYRSFASVVSIIAALMSAVVLIAGAAGVLFLLLERRPFPAMAAMMLSIAFAAMIVMLIPPTNVTIYDGSAPAMTIAQQSGVSFPTVTWSVMAPDGHTIARIHKSFLSRLGVNRWRVDSGTSHGEAAEESFSRALVRKIFGKFAAVYQSNVRLTWDGDEAGWIIRRPDALGRADILDLHPALTLDRRIAVAVAVLVLASEP